MGEDRHPAAAARVFVSYSHADRARVEPIVEALTRHGHTVWWDHHITGGARFSKEINMELQRADAVLVAWSASSVESDWVLDEASTAHKAGRLVPVRLDRISAPLGFGQYHILDFSTWNGRAESPEVHRLNDAIARAASADPGAARASTPTSRFERRRGPDRRSLLIGGLAAIPVAGAAAWWLMKPAPPPRSLAVLPFANLSGDPGQDYVSEGLSEELIATLSRLGSLQVAGRTSSFRFKGSKEAAADIGDKLGVAYLLNGSVRRDGDLVRVNTELVEAKTGFGRWSHTYDRQAKDILAVQTGIAQAVAEALNLQLGGSEIAALTVGGTLSPEAYDAYLQGRRLLDLGGGEATYREALARFDAAVAADPNYAAAHAARARVLVNIAGKFSSQAQLRANNDSALDAARRAVALAPNLGEAQATLGDTLENANLDFAGARIAFGRAMAVGAGDADVLTRFGLFSCAAGEFAPGLAAARRATVLDPLNPRMFRNLGFDLILARRYPEAVLAYRQSLALNPRAAFAHGMSGAALVMQGRLAEARAEYELEPTGWLRQSGLAITLHRIGSTKAADEALRAFLADPASADQFYQKAEILAQRGDLDGAFQALEKAFSRGDSGLVMLKNDPLLDPLRQDRRYIPLVRRLGLQG